MKPRNFGSQTDLNSACLQDAAREAIQKHGGVRPAARALQLTAAYLSRISRGAKVWPNDKLLKKLGVRRSVIYWKLAEPQLPDPPEIFELPSTFPAHICRHGRADRTCRECFPVPQEAKP